MPESSERGKQFARKLNRISKVKVLDERFTAKDDGAADKLFSSSVGIFRSDKPQRFRIRFDAETAPWAIETPFHQKQTVAQRRDGGVTIEISSAYEDEIIPRVLGLGAHAEILQPKSARDKVKKTARELSRIYS